MASVMNMVTLVNALGEPIGQMEKLEAHQKGLLHLAFSVLIFNDQQEILIQQRASTKYHSPDLWANACCSHPEPDDTRSMECIARDRLQFEMGIDCVLKLSSQMTYISHFDNGLTEHEYDHILVGYCNETPKPNPDEVSATRWLSLQRLKHELRTHPEHFASWFIKLFQQQHIHVIQ